MKILDFNVIVENVESLDKLLSGGLVLPNNFTIPMAFGRVTQIGPGRFNEKHNVQVPVDLEVGDLVVYNPGVSKEIELSVKAEDGTVQKKKLNKVMSTECMLVLAEDRNGQIVGIKSVKENYVLIKRDATDKKTAGGIYILEMNKTINNITGTVYLSGPGKYNAELNKRVPCMAQPGDKVAFIEMQAIQLTIPMKNEKGEIVKEKFYEVPDSGLDILLTTDKEGNMNGVKKIKDKHVLVKRASGEKKTSGGIYLPELDQEGHFVEATVIMLGDKLTSDVKVGDKIVYVDAKDNNKELKLPIAGADGKVTTEKCYILAESDIEVILDDETL